MTTTSQANQPEGIAVTLVELISCLSLVSLSLCESNNIRVLEKSLINKRHSGQDNALTRRLASVRFTAIRAVRSDH